MKLFDGFIQIARQVGDRLRADHCAGQRGYHAAHLASRDPAQKSFPNQHRHLRRAGRRPEYHGSVMPTTFTLSTFAHLWFTFCAIAVLEGIAVYTWQFRAERGARWHVAAQTCLCLWLAAIAAAQWGQGSLWGTAGDMATWYLAIASVYIWFRFFSELSGYDREAPRWLEPSIRAGALLCWLLYTTNPWHHLIWVQTREAGVLVGRYGSLCYFFTYPFAYGVNLLSVGIIVRWARGCRGLRRRQAWAFLAPNLLGWAGQFLSTRSWAGRFDPHTVFFLLAGVAMAWAFFRWRSYSVLPLAQEAMLRSMIDGLMVVDEDGYVVRLNTAARSIFAGAAEEGVRFEAVARVCPALLPLREARSPQVLEANWKIAGSNRFFQAQTTPLYASAGHLLGQVFCFEDITLEKAQQARIVDQQKAISLLEERARLGRELHDDQGQLWSYLAMQLGAVRKRMEQGDRERAFQLLEQLQTVVQDTHVGLREAINGLSTGDTLKNGLLAALEEQLRWYRQHCGWEATLQLDGVWDEKLLSLQTEAQLMRILQEAFSNARKSAQASQVRVVIGRAEDALTFLVEDDGRGFDLEKARQEAGHHGLRMMRERADKIGAELRVESEAGKGTRVTVTVPAAAERRAAEDGSFLGAMQ